LLLHFQDELVLEKRWQLNGSHYRRTCETWLANQDRHREPIPALFQEVYGPHQAGPLVPALAGVFHSLR
jgi:cyclopropane-fatty-acyl-phospholipid synthase